MSKQGLLENHWQTVLYIIEKEGWKSAKNELKRQISSLENLKKHRREEYETYLLILGTLEQKFGELKSAAKTLCKIERSVNRHISLDATIRLAKILSQKGLFVESNEKLHSIFPQKSSIKAWLHPDGVSGSILWRLGFLNGINGNIRESSYWLERHKDFSKKHGSQEANNIVFSNLVRIVSGDFQYIQSIDTNKRGFEFYLKDSLSVENVKYINISKSIVVPLLLDGVILISLKNTLDGLLQILLCRRLIQFDNLTLSSEGIAETIHSIKTIGDGLINGVIKYFYTSEAKFIYWLKSYVGDEKFVNQIIDLREIIFKEFIESRDYNLLSIVHSNLIEPIFPKRKNIMLKKKKVFLIHGHDELNLLRLKNYLVDDLQIEAVILKELSTGGNTIIEQFEKMAVDCDHAFAIFTKDDRINSKKDPYLQARPNVLFELGWFYGKLGRKNVTVLFQEGVKIPSDLDGLLRIQFRENILDKSREIKKELE